MSAPDPRFPIGPFQRPPLPLDTVTRGRFIDDIERLPQEIRAAVSGLSETELETPYRPGGWTARQVVHHVPDSHMNAYIRFKLALTEEAPTIKPYAEALWSEMPDARQAPVAISLELLDALHRRWALMLRGMSDADFGRSYMHPEMGLVGLETALALYSWHGQHHTAHIASLRG